MLISNAIKFTKEGKIIIRASELVHDNLIKIEVEDSGPGIANEI